MKEREEDEKINTRNVVNQHFSALLLAVLSGAAFLKRGCFCEQVYAGALTARAGDAAVYGRRVLLSAEGRSRTIFHSILQPRHYFSISVAGRRAGE